MALHTPSPTEKSNRLLRALDAARVRSLAFFWKSFPRVWLALPAIVRKPLKQAKSLWDGRLMRSHQAALSELIENHADTDPIIVFAPSLDWNVQLFQRPQQLALAFARQGALVFYPQPKPNFKKPPFQPLIDGLYLCNIVISAFDILESPIVYVLTWNSGYVPRFRSPRILYDYVDDTDVFYGDRQEIVKGHEYLVKEADYVVVTAEKLRLGLDGIRPDAIFCPNGVDYDQFLPAREKEAGHPPEDLVDIVAQGKPIIGYYGALARWFDYDLLDRIAELRPDYAFVLIGPDYDGTVRAQKALRRPNVHWLGVKPYRDLPAYLRYFDAATIPFVVSDITHATSPLKLFEYMAGGKPVVVTPMHESMRYPGVLVGRDPEEFAARLDEALTLRSEADYLETIDGVARSNTWDSRAMRILTALKRPPALKRQGETE